VTASAKWQQRITQREAESLRCLDTLDVQPQLLIPHPSAQPAHEPGMPLWKVLARHAENVGYLASRKSVGLVEWLVTLS